MRLRLVTLVPAVALLVALNVLAARGRERTITTTMSIDGAGATVETADLVQRGRNLFSAKGCASCHVEMQVGPSLTGIQDRAAKAKQGLSADQYVRESILVPNAFRAPGRSGNISAEMPPLPVNAAELAALVAYVLTL